MNTRFLSRRDWLKLTAAAAVSINTLPILGQEKPDQKAPAALSFICVNDLHFSSKNEAPFFKTMVEEMKAVEPKPKLLLAAGDLVDSGTAVQFDAIKEIFAESGIMLKVCIGNHDWASATDKKAFERAFPDSLNYNFEMDGWQFVVLDTTNGVNNQANKAPQATFDWLDANLGKLDKKQPLILMTHYPIGQGVRNRSGSANDILTRFKEHNFKAAFTAHYHANTEVKYGDAMIYTGRCCSVKANNHDGSKEKGFVACVAGKDGAVTRKFIQVG
jgi:hypothetical protein